jgi:hypothetical protein
MCAVIVVLTIAPCHAQLVQSQIVKGNAIGSLFYGVGFATPGVLKEAFTGQPSGRRLLQDPYHLTSKVLSHVNLSFSRPLALPAATGTCQQFSQSLCAAVAASAHVLRCRGCFQSHAML